MKLLALLLLKAVPRRLRLVCYGAAGGVLGLGVCVLKVSNAASYLSDDPKACINCHIMYPEYASWRHSSHARVANCNDCHVPHDSVLRKYWFKSKDGMRHSYMFTFHMERQVIQAIPESREVIQANCMRCHSTVVSALGDIHAALPTSGESGLLAVTRGTFERRCIDCHREVPHGRVHSLSSTPNAAVPPLSPVTPSWFPRSERSEGKK